MRTKYIGCFEVESNRLLICDPAATSLACEAYSLLAVNSIRIPIHAKNGLWYAYHVFDESDEVAGLLIHHKNVEDNSFSLSEMNNLGKVCSMFGKSVAIVDKKYYNSSEYTYQMANESTVYDIEELKEWINEKDILKEESKNELFDYLQTYLDQNREVIFGYELNSFLGNDIRNISSSSTLWSYDCECKIKHEDCNASTIKGGVVAKSDTDFINCYAYYEDSEAIKTYLSLNNQSLVNYYATSSDDIFKDTKNSNIIPFPTDYTNRATSRKILIKPQYVLN